MASRYYIRFRGRKLGPLTVDRLHALAKRGRFARHYEVSTDGKRWMPAADYPELFPDSSGADDEYDEFGGGDDEMPEDPWADDPDQPRKKKGKTRRRQKTQSFTPPPPPPIDDTPIDSAGSGDEPAPRRKRTTRRTVTRPAAMDDDAPIVDEEEEIIEEVRPAGKARRSRRRRVVASEEDYDDETGGGGSSGAGGGGTTIIQGGGGSTPSTVNVNVTVEQTGGRRSTRTPTPTPRRSNPSLFDMASAQTEQLHKLDDDDEDDEEDAPKKKKRFFGLFGGKEVEESKLEPYLQKMYDLTEVLGTVKFGMEKVILIGSGGEEINVADHMRSGDGADIIGLLTMLAFQSKSSDIHFEPGPDGADIRMRIDGSLVQLVHLPQSAVNKTYGVCKVLCECDLGSRREIQEGNYSVVAPGRRVDYRVSFTPSVHGQKLAIRVLDLENSPQSMKQLGAPPRLLRTLRDVMTQNAGMVLMCGPTGSGKTTTLYSLIRGIDVKTRNVMTLEDPVEYQIDGVTQMSIDKEHGKGFSEMLPAMLRQDPDVLLIGEIRDAVSAQISMQATMTGHLVLSTVHAPDTLSTLYRLLDLNADANMVGAALDIVLSQRLVKVLCRECKKKRRLTKPEAQRLGKYAKDYIFDPKGCKRCLGTGFTGRRAIFEMLDVKHQLGDSIYQAKSLGDLRKSVDRKTFVTLRESGHQLVAKGVTSFSEVDRVIGVH